MEQTKESFSIQAKSIIGILAVIALIGWVAYIFQLRDDRDSAMVVTAPQSSGVSVQPSASGSEFEPNEVDKIILEKLQWENEQLLADLNRTTEEMAYFRNIAMETQSQPNAGESDIQMNLLTEKIDNLDAQLTRILDDLAVLDQSSNRGGQPGASEQSADAESAQASHAESILELNELLEKSANSLALVQGVYLDYLQNMDSVEEGQSLGTSADAPPSTENHHPRLRRQIERLHSNVNFALAELSALRAASESSNQKLDESSAEQMKQSALPGEQIVRSHVIQPLVHGTASALANLQREYMDLLDQSDLGLQVHATDTAVHATENRNRHIQTELENSLAMSMTTQDRENLNVDLESALAELEAIRALNIALKEQIASDSGQALEQSELNRKTLREINLLLKEDLESVEQELTAMRSLYGQLKDQFEQAKVLLAKADDSDDGSGSASTATDSSDSSSNAIVEREEMLQQMEELVAQVELTQQELGKFQNTGFQIFYLKTRLKYASDHLRRLRKLQRETTEENVRLVEAVDAIKDELQGVVAARDISVETQESGLAIITLQADILFDSGSVELSANGETTLRALNEKIKEYPDRIVSLEGHTDNVPISERLLDIYPSNWELSSARAASAAKFMISEGADVNQIRVVGHSDMSPVASNETEEGRERNRRLEIRLYPKLEDVQSS